MALICVNCGSTNRIWEDNTRKCSSCSGKQFLLWDYFDDPESEDPLFYIGNRQFTQLLYNPMTKTAIEEIDQTISKVDALTPFDNFEDLLHSLWIFCDLLDDHNIDTTEIREQLAK